MPGEVLSDAAAIRELINGKDIEAKYIQVGADTAYNSSYPYSQTGKGSIQCKNFYIAEELIGPGGWNGVDENAGGFAQGIKLSSGFYGLFYNGGISYFGSTASSSSNATSAVKTSGTNDSNGPSYPIINYYMSQGSED